MNSGKQVVQALSKTRDSCVERVSSDECFDQEVVQSRQKKSELARSLKKKAKSHSTIVDFGIH